MCRGLVLKCDFCSLYHLKENKWKAQLAPEGRVNKSRVAILEEFIW